MPFCTVHNRYQAAIQVAVLVGLLRRHQTDNFQAFCQPEHSQVCRPAVVASEKGVVVGRLTFREDGDLIDCQRMGVGGKAVPPNVDKVSKEFWFAQAGCSMIHNLLVAVTTSSKVELQGSHPAARMSSSDISSNI